MNHPAGGIVNKTGLADGVGRGAQIHKGSVHPAAALALGKILAKAVIKALCAPAHPFTGITVKGLKGAFVAADFPAKGVIGHIHRPRFADKVRHGSGEHTIGLHQHRTGGNGEFTALNHLTKRVIIQHRDFIGSDFGIRCIQHQTPVERRQSDIEASFHHKTIERVVTEHHGAVIAAGARFIGRKQRVDIAAGTQI